MFIVGSLIRLNAADITVCMAHAAVQGKAAHCRFLG